MLLAPTCNIQRNPLGGRAFESFSEDPHLSGMITTFGGVQNALMTQHELGMIAAAYVRGLQSKGVAAVIKHFVGNDQEHERTAANSVMSDRALREVYLYPYAIVIFISRQYVVIEEPVHRFMIAQRDASPWAYMTS